MITLQQKCAGESVDSRSCIPEIPLCREHKEWDGCNVSCDDRVQNRTQICIKGQNCSNVVKEGFDCSKVTFNES